MCPEVSFFFQFSAFMMLMASVPLALGCVKLSEDMAKPAKRLRRGRR